MSSAAYACSPVLLDLNVPEFDKSEVSRRVGLLTSAIVRLSRFPAPTPKWGWVDEIESTRERKPTLERRAIRWTLAVALALAAAASYSLVLTVWLPGMDGCGPPGNTTAARIWVIGPFALPCLGALIFVIVGSARRWRRSWLVRGACAVVVLGGMVEFVVFAEVVAGIHHCFA